MLLRCDPTLPRYGTDPIQEQFQSFEAKPFIAKRVWNFCSGRHRLRKRGFLRSAFFTEETISKTRERGPDDRCQPEQP